MQDKCVLRGAAALLVAAGIVAQGAGARPLTPQLRLIRVHPVTVHGTSFRRAERVKLALETTVGGTWKTSVTADASGSFDAAFMRAQVSRCTGFTVRAAGSAGSRAVAKRPPLPACMPA